MKLTTIAGIVMLGTVVFVVLASQSTHATVTASPAPTPSVVATATHATPQPTPGTWDLATNSAAHLAVLAWLVALAMLPFVIYVAIALVGRHRSKLPTQDWRIPYRAPEFPRVLDAHVKTSHPPVPQSITYSPHLRQDATDLIEDEEIPPPLGELLTVERALDMPGIVYGQRLDTGEALVDNRVLSLAIGGRPGSGKTSTVVLLAAQYARMGASLYVGDPHSGHPDSLLTRLEPLTGRLEGMAETPREGLVMVDRASEMLERRKSLWRHHSGDQRPLVVILDEFAESLRLLPPGDRERLLDKVQVIGYSGRKYGVACLLLAQSWLVGAIATSQVRNPLRAAIVHSMRADEGRALTGLRQDAWPADPLDLPAGQAYVLGVGTSGLIRVRVPLIEPTRTRAILPPASQALPPHFPSTSTEPNGGGREVDGKRSGSASEVLPEAAVLRLFREGRSVGAIVRELTGERGGRSFQQAHDEVLAIIRAQLPADEA